MDPVPSAARQSCGSTGGDSGPGPYRPAAEHRETHMSSPSEDLKGTYPVLVDDEDQYSL